MADELNNGQQVQSTEGHELELITVAGLKAALQKFKTDIVDPMQWPMLPVAELPTASANTMHKLYFVPSPNPEENNEKDEFITLETIVEGQSTYSWELIGSTAIDLSNYATLQAVEDTFAAVHADGVAVVTLSSAPTSSTTTYTKGEQTVNFKISDEVRVADAEQSSEEANSYVYYKLYDLVENQGVKTAYWALIGVKKESAFGEITVSITPYINDIESLASSLGNVSVTLTNLTDGGTPQVLTWSGSDVTFQKVMPLKNYRVSIEDKTGWLRDKSYVDITNLDIAGQESVSFTYSADEYTCVVTGTSDGRIVVSGAEYANGATFRVSKGTSITATAKAVTNFVTPTATITNKTISAAYAAYGYITVSTSSNQGTDSTIAAVTPTIKIGDAAAVSYTAPVQVAPSTEVIVTWPAVTGYKAPAQITFTKNGTTDEAKSGEYQTELVTVTVDTDETEVTAEGQIITINGSNYTVGASGVVTAKVAFDTVYSVSANAWSGQNDYTTPESQANITAAIASRNITMTYLKIRGTLYSLVVTDNQSGASGAASNANITVKYIKDNTETILGTTFKNGDTFLIPNGATITVTGGSITNFAPTTTSSGTTYTVTYKAQKITVTISGNSENGTVTLKNTTKGTTINSGTSSFSGYVTWGNYWSIISDITASKYPKTISTKSGVANTTSKSVTVTYDVYTLITSGAVDLGLPSGKLWSAVNVGASSYYDKGYYFSWGNTAGHAKNSGYNFSSSNYSSTTGAGLAADFTSGNATYDAARANMGGAWRTPRNDEFNELLNSSYTTWVWCTLNSVNGRLVVSKTNSKAIFLPASGYYNGTSLSYSGTYGGYWSTKYNSSTSAYYLYFNGSDKDMYFSSRYLGQSVRAIKDPEAVDLGNGVKWATGNLTKDSSGNYSIAAPTEYGAYFSWGDIIGHYEGEGYDFNDSNYYNGSSGSGHNLTTGISFSSGDATYDAARAKLGGSWRMPTYNECKWIIDNCTWTWKVSGNTDYNGVAGYEVVGTNGNKIFLPCAGYYNGTSLNNSGPNGLYWSNLNYFSDTNRYAYYLSFDSLGERMNSFSKRYGVPVRPVDDIPL